MKPRIAIIGTGMIASSVFAQGIPAFVSSLYHLSKSCDVTIYSFASLDKNHIPPFIRTRYLPPGLHQRVQYFLLGVSFLWDHFRGRYVAIHAQSPFPAGVFATAMSKILRVKCVVSLHAGETASQKEQQFGDLLKPGMADLTRRICQGADTLTTMSKYQAELTRKNLRLERSIEVFPRGIEIRERTFPEKKLEAPLRYIFLANFHPVKDPETLLLAFKQIVIEQEASLVIIGDNYKEGFSERILQLGLEGHITPMGALPHEQAMEQLQQAHVLLNTSFYEALPMTAMEAMAAGVAIVGTHVGIMADLAEECCLTVSPGDYRALALKAIKLTSDQDAYDGLRTSAYQWVKQHSMEKYIQRLLGFYGVNNQ